MIHEFRGENFENWESMHEMRSKLAFAHRPPHSALSMLSYDISNSQHRESVTKSIIEDVIRDRRALNLL